MTWLSPLAWMALLGPLATLTSLVLAWGASGSPGWRQVVNKVKSR